MEPPPSSWGFPPPEEADEHGVVGIGADLEPGTLLHAYRSGLFPMPLGGSIGWWSPDPRGVLPLDGLVISRSLASASKRYEIRVDTAFDEVIAQCADPRRPGGWITRELIDAYGRLHRLGWAHSVEAWDDDGLAGGLYGLAIGGLFAGESMFHRRRDASKAALVGLVDLLRDDGADRLLDVQWRTDHLATLGVVEIPRAEYLARLGRALEQPLPARWATSSSRAGTRPGFGGHGPVGGSFRT
ncbi:MAG: leucyl/phenylalanyl-tRNA--protein transferase [Actinomycetota bacterium]|nr:leucyl/phenylalanyl-tRNA--protein transferase [Actinomycetota bacterium]